jgi:hypothetical protein
MEKREIKFRAWTEKEMIFRGLHDRNWYTEDKGGKLVKGTHPDDNHFLKVMQFTGMKDALGIEIYEGDVCEISGWNIKFVVIYDTNSSRFTVQKSDKTSVFDYIPTTTTKVIGNVFECDGFLNFKD